MCDIQNIYDNVSLKMTRSKMKSILKEKKDKSNNNESIADKINNLMSLLFNIRDIRCGRGFKNVSYWMFLELYYKYPEYVIKYLKLFIDYGCWQDLNVIGFMAINDKIALCDPWYKDELDIDENEERILLINMLTDKIIDLFCEGLKDKDNKDNQYLCAKWSAREDKKFWCIGREVALKLYPAKTRNMRYTSYKKYNNLIKNICRRDGLVEDTMCNGVWTDIKPENITHKCRVKNNSAFLNRECNNKYKMRTVREDRIGCALNFMKYYENVDLNFENVRNKGKSLMEILESARYNKVCKITSELFEDYSYIEDDFVLV